MSPIGPAGHRPSGLDTDSGTEKESKQREMIEKQLPFNSYDEEPRLSTD